jgi:hypothetical protein
MVWYTEALFIQIGKNLLLDTKTRPAIEIREKRHLHFSQVSFLNVNV